MVSGHKWLIRWSIATTMVAGGVFALSGRWTDPWFWAYAIVWSLTAIYAMSSMDEDLARERFSPPSPGADRLSLRWVRLLALVHIVVGALDTGRWHLTEPVPSVLRGAALAGMACAFALVFRSMRENRFFSAVVRVQTERGHRVIESGPYSVIRHPGYAGMILGMPLSGLALGSWISFALALTYSALILRRVLFEDRFLKSQLDGYAEYAERVRARLIPGVW